MSDLYREGRYRERDDDDSGDERRHATVRRYKVSSPSKYDDDDRGRYSPRTTTLIEKQVIEPYGDDHRSFSHEKDQHRERRRDHDHVHDDDRSRGFIYDRDFDRDREWGRGRGHDDADLRMDKRMERPPDGDLTIQRRFEEHIDKDGDGHADVERYRKETEYYSPYDTPAPVIVPRHEPNVMTLPHERPRELVHRPRHDDEYYYRRESREIGPYRREENEVERHGRRRSRHHTTSNGYCSDDGYMVRRRRRTIVRDRSPSTDSDHKLHLAEGALAGAGVTALLSSRRDKNGDLPDHRGRKVVAGAALGALGTEAYKRARSAYGEKCDRYRSPSRDRHSRIKTGLGIAAAALAVAGATQYYKANKVEKEESKRGRSRTKDYRSDSEYYSSRSPSRKRSRSRSIAKAALATMGAAGLAKHLRNRSKSKGRSRSRSASTKSRSRSRSRLRTGAGLAAAAVAAGTAGNLYKKHRDKSERGQSRSSSASASFYQPKRYGSRSRSRSRSATRSIHSQTGQPADCEQGLVEYGHGNLPERRRRRRRDRSRSLGEDSESDGGKKGKKRSRSRLRDMAATAVGTGAAAMGMKEYRKRRKSKEGDRDVSSEGRRSERRRRERDSDVSSGDDPRDRRRRERDRRRQENDVDYNDGPYPPSPPHASGGYSGGAPPPHMSGAINNYSTYPPQTYFPMPPADPQAPYPTTPGEQGYPPPPPPDVQGYSPHPTQGPDAYYPPAAPGILTPGYQPPEQGPSSNHRPPPMGPDHVSRKSRRPPARQARSATGDDDVRPRSVWDRLKHRMSLPPIASHDVEDEDEDDEDLYPPRPGGRKGVAFTRLSPRSSKAIHRHRRHRSRSTRPRSEHRDVYEPGPSVERPKSVVSDPDVEYLPDRFDIHGTPLSRDASPGRARRSGQFRRRPRHAGDWSGDGGWHVSGTDKETVERMAKSIRDVIDGRTSWLELVGGVMESLNDDGRRRGSGRRDGKLRWQDLMR